MNALSSRRPLAWLGEGLCWVAFYLTIHFDVNDEYLSFWAPLKFIVAVPQAAFCLLAVYSFGWLFTRPLDTPVGRLVLFGVVTFVLLHVVYYYAMGAAQPYAPIQSVTYRRWALFMQGNGPLYFLHNRRYLLTVSPFLYSAMICLPIGLKLLRDTMRENQRLAAAQQQRLTWELEAVRTRLNPAFFQQSLAHVVRLLDQHQAPTAAEVTLKLAQVLRHTLYETRNVLVPLQAELDAYLDYVQLQELRLQDQVEVTVRLTVEASAAERVLAGILLPITEAVLGQAASYCEVELRVQNHRLHLSLRADSESAQPLTSVESVRARLAQYAAGTYRLHHQPHEATTVLLLDLSLLASTLPAVAHY